MLCKILAIVVGMSDVAVLMTKEESISSGGRTKDEFPPGT